MAEPWAWTLDDNASDLVSGSGELFNRRMLHWPEEIGTFVVTVPAGTTKDGFFYSPANQPGNHDWPGGEPWTVRIYVVSGNPRIELQVFLNRVDGAGTVLEVYSPVTGLQNLGSAGPRTFTGTTQAQVAAPLPTSGHRLRVGLKFIHDGKLGSQDVTLGFGDPERDTVEVPILMGNPAITWNGNTLAFPGPLTRYDADVDADREIAFSGGRVSATLLHSMGDTVHIETGNFDDAQFEADLRAWWSWAAQGKQYAFALDSADVVNLTLNGAAAAGQKDIPLADTSSVVVGRRYLLREAAGPEEEIIQVASIVANVKAVAQANLKFGYLTGDRFRAIDYFPKMVSLDEKKPWRQHFTTWSLEHSMAEDRG